MGMSMSVVGVVDITVDDKYEKMKAVWDACEAAGVEIPNEVDEFFEGEDPEDCEKEVKLSEECAESWGNGDMQEGFQVTVAKIPKDIKYIRFICSY